jgi:CDGSH-type Zn-finger protein
VPAAAARGGAEAGRGEKLIPLPAEDHRNIIQTYQIMPDTKITVMKNGPLRIEGDFSIVDPTGTAYGLGGRTILSLCRCGESKNKPFCDGSHNHHGFQDEPAARDLPPKPGA